MKKLFNKKILVVALVLSVFVPMVSVQAQTPATPSGPKGSANNPFTFGSPVAVPVVKDPGLTTGNVLTGIGQTTGLISKDQTPSCSFSPSFSITYCANVVIKYLMDIIILPFFGFFLWIAGSLFDFVLKFTIVQMGARVDGIDAINQIWTFFRDLVNMLFIFVLMYIGVSTILGLKDNWKSQLKNIVIAGLLINFSLFITKVPIDLSNIVSIQIYKAIVAKAPTTQTNLGKNVGSLKEKSVSAAFMQYIKMQTIYSGSPNEEGTGAVASTVIQALFAVALILIITCVFFAATGMLIMRFFLLVYAMIISPLFFLGIIMPKAADAIGNDWKKNLLAQCLFAPVFLLLLLVSLKFMVALNAGIDKAAVFGKLTDKGSLESIATLIINYIFVIGMFIGSLEVARKIGARGGSFMDKHIDKLKTAPARWAAKAPAATAGWAGRNTVGKASNYLANSKAMKYAASTTGLKTISRAVQGNLEKTAKSSFDIRNTPMVAGVLGEGVKSGYKDIAKEDREYGSKYARTEKTTAFKKAKAAFEQNPNDMGAKKKFVELLRDRSNAELEDMSVDDINKHAEHFKASQIEYLKGDKSHLTEKEKGAFKAARKAVLGKIVEDVKYQTNQLKDPTLENPQMLEDALKANKKRFEAMGTAEVAKLELEELLVLEEAGMLNNKHLKKVLEEDKLDSEQFSKLAQEIIKKNKPGGKKSAAYQFITHRDNAGFFDVDPEKLKDEEEKVKKATEDLAKATEKATSNAAEIATKAAEKALVDAEVAADEAKKNRPGINDGTEGITYALNETP